MQKKLAIIIALILVIFGCSLTAIKLMQRVPDNDPYTVGNTAGNLNNEGLFCEDNGIIYFVNVSDNNYLYSMNSDGSDVKCVYANPVSYINSAGDYLYFYQETDNKGGVFESYVRSNGIYRLKKNTNQSPKCLDRTLAKELILTGSDLYYEHYSTTDGLTLYNVGIGGGGRHEVVPTDINPVCIYQGNIFFSDTDNNFFFSCLRTDSGAINTVIADMKTFNLQYDNDHFYYLNVSDDYKLYRYDIGSDHVTKLTNRRVDTFNVLNDVVYYQQNGTDDAALIRMDGDGSNPTVVANGNYKNISMTENYTFFRPFDEDEDDIYYYTRNVGNPSPQKFAP